jgi:hypothetical protein
LPRRTSWQPPPLLMNFSRRIIMNQYCVCLPPKRCVPSNTFNDFRSSPASCGDSTGVAQYVRVSKVTHV